jgi:hypothetical protein
LQVSLDFDGLRQSIIASQRVVALKEAFGLGKTAQSDQEEEAYIKGIIGAIH